MLLVTLKWSIKSMIKYFGNIMSDTEVAYHDYISYQVYYDSQFA